MGTGMLRPYCRTRCACEAKGAGTTTPGRRASRCKDTQPSLSKVRNASCFDGLSLPSMATPNGPKTRGNPDLLPPQTGLCQDQIEIGSKALDPNDFLRYSVVLIVSVGL